MQPAEQMPERYAMKGVMLEMLAAERFGLLPSAFASLPEEERTVLLVYDTLRRRQEQAERSELVDVLMAVAGLRR